MSNLVIADLSCLIGLSKIDKLTILNQLFGTILIPPAVFNEVVNLGAGRPGADEVKNAVWIETRKIENELAVKAFKLNLGSGEAEAIALATECNTDFIILDDWRARQVALSLSLPVIGTVAVLKKAHEKGFIKDFEATLIALRQSGFHYSLI